MRGWLVCMSLFSALFFPWPFTTFVAVLCVGYEPFIPLATGLFIDTLYYTPSLGVPPFATLCGACVTGIALFVRSRLRTGIMDE